QATLYDALPQAKRVALHQAVGEALEHVYDVEAGEGLAEVALHFLQAAPGHDPARAVRYAQPARGPAGEEDAYHPAVSLYARARAVSTSAPRRMQLLLSLGEAQTRAGDTEGARATLTGAAELAQAHGDASGLARATLALGIWGLTAGYDSELVRLAELA